MPSGKSTLLTIELHPMTKKAINLKDFQLLDTDEQVLLLHRDGAYAGKREEGGQVSVLYQLYGFYAEIWYTEYRRKIDHVVSSANTDLLQPYLDQLNVRDLDLPPGGDSPRGDNQSGA